MGYGRSETWLWRFVGVGALVVCTFNIMVLYSGQSQMNASIRDQLLQFEERQKKHQATALNSTTLIHFAPHKDTKLAANAESAEPVLTSRPASKNQLAPSKPPIYKVPNGVPRRNNPPPPQKEVPVNVPLSLKKPIWLDVLSIKNFMSKALILGKKRTDPGYLIIGVPTVGRVKGDYLKDTLSGLINNLSDAEKEEVRIVVFVADFAEDYRNKVKALVTANFDKDVKSGLIQVIVAAHEFYPDMHNLPLLYGDKLSRVQWRSKQSLDYAFMYYYCSDNLGKYYIQVEDDILVSPNYFKTIKKVINVKSLPGQPPWSILEFGARGFIGMMYRSENLLSLARYSRLYFWTMPIDWIFRTYNDIYLHGNPKGQKVLPPIFKHVGKFSSLTGQVRKLEDVKVANQGKAEVIPHIYQQGDNPTAEVTTSMSEYVVPHNIQKPYGSVGFFWAKKVRTGDSIDIKLTEAARLNKIVFASGSKMYPHDSFMKTDLLISGDTDDRCLEYRTVFESTSAVVDYAPPAHLKIKCIRLVVRDVKKDKHGHYRWLILSEIALLVS